jgi:hypothetical protein
MFLGAAGGIMASHLAGFPESAGVAVAIGAAVAAVLRLPLSAIVIATLLTVHAGGGVEPLIIVGVVVSYVVTLAFSRVTARTTEEPASRPVESAPTPTAIPSPAAFEGTVT